MPGNTKTNEIFWLSVFCIPYSISFAHVYLPFKDMTVPMPSGNHTSTFLQNAYKVKNHKN
uniref:DM13 domain-containing protein n=1 Tax=Romanomermis culicivorax TaxID=13658 RepID=A0A915HT63_ROMCU